MGLRFRKSVKIAPGVRLNLGKKSASVSIGGKGIRKSFSTTGRKTTTFSLPGTGLSYVSTESAKGKKSKQKKASASNGDSTMRKKNKKKINPKTGAAVVAAALAASFIFGKPVEEQKEQTSAASNSISASVELPDDPIDQADEVQQEEERPEEDSHAPVEEPAQEQEPSTDTPDQPETHKPEAPPEKPVEEPSTEHEAPPTETVVPAPIPVPDPVTEPEPAPVPVPDPGSVTDSGPAEYTYVKSKNSDVFHRSSSDCENTIKEKNRQYFTCTRDEMTGKGYDPCQNCNP